MALVAGTITTNPDGTYSGTGLAIVLMTARWAAYTTQFAAYDPPLVPTLAQKVAINAQLSSECAELAMALVTYLTANAEIDPGTFNISTVAVTGTGTLA